MIQRILLIPAAAFALAACDTEVDNNNPPSERVIDRDTTIVSPPSTKEEKDTTIVNPPAPQRQESTESSSTTITNPPSGSGTQTQQNKTTEKTTE